MHIGLTLVTVVPCYLISSSTDGTLIGLFFDIIFRMHIYMELNVILMLNTFPVPNII